MRHLEALALGNCDTLQHTKLRYVTIRYDMATQWRHIIYSGQGTRNNPPIRGIIVLSIFE